MKWLTLSLFVILFLGLGCNLSQKEEELQKKEAALNQKDQELLLKEKTLQIKEQELLEQEKKRDSTRYADTILDHLAFTGTWSVKMTCTETTCTGSAVGDTKVEQWAFSKEMNTIIVQATAANKLVRTYTGKFTGNNTILLTDARQNTDTLSSTRMEVRLQLTNETTMEGQREINRDNTCKVIYALQLEKQLAD